MTTKFSAWASYDGSRLDHLLRPVPSLGGAPVRLVDAHYFLGLAGYAKEDGKFRLAAQPRPMPRRQDLPDEAFLSHEQVQSARSLGIADCLRIVIVSHPWLQPDHCDPKCANLEVLGRAIRAIVVHRRGTVAIFLDFLSLHQKDADGVRTANEADLFGRALSSLSDLYSHPHVFTLKVTRLPADYPAGYSFPPGTSPNRAPYEERGWCFMESCVSNFKSNRAPTWDLGMADTDVDSWTIFVIRCGLATEGMHRLPPMTPAEFRDRLESKTFTNGKADRPLVARIYKSAFEAALGDARNLEFNGLAWDDADALTLARVVESGVLVKLERMNLYGHAMGDEGMRALASAVDRGGLPACKLIDTMPGRGATSDGGVLQEALRRARDAPEEEARSKVQALQAEYRRGEDEVAEDEVVVSVLTDGHGGAAREQRGHGGGMGGRTMQCFEMCSLQ